MTVRSGLISLVLLVLVSTASSSRAVAQESRAPALYDTVGTAWVYASYYQVPWSRVDSLIKLQRFRPAWRDRAVAMGCFLDTSLLIHHTGNEYNVVLATTYSSFRDIGPGAPRADCSGAAWRAAVPDSSLRTAIAAGNRWVYDNVPHYDQIFWVPYARRP